MKNWKIVAGILNYIITITYPLKEQRSAMAPDTIVAQVAANVHWKKKNG